jgi:[ribosomal protein S5]-alanine N-acetyltransferase
MSRGALPYPDPALEDGRIRLRRWLESDLECVRQAATDPRIPRGTTVPSDFTTSDGLAFIHRQWSRADRGEGVSQAIVDIGADRAIGLVSFVLRSQPHVGGLGYWVVPGARGSGVAKAAVRLVIPWALATFDLWRLEAWVEPQNTASQRVLESVGFSHEGLLRNFLSIRGTASDALVYSVVRDSIDSVDRS